MARRASRAYPLNAKNLFGLSTMRWTVIAGSSLMTSAFMMYLTDYSGLAHAAVIATVLLTFGRILDAVDDPVQGWIMDASKPTRIGKFKPFLLGGIVVATLALVMLFNMPQGVADWFRIAYLFLGYVLFEIGVSFQPDMAIKATMTDDPKVRERLLVTPRIVETFIAIPFTFFLSIALGFGKTFGNNQAGFSLATVLLVLPIAGVAFVGATMIKEGPIAVHEDAKVGLKDIARMFRSNKPLWISQLAGFLAGNIFTFVVAAVTYYIKWAYGPKDFGMNAAVWGAMILFGIVVGTLVASPILKRVIPVHGMMICNIGAVIPLGVVFLLNLAGPVNYYLFFGLMFLSLVFSGMGYIPGSLVGMEVMDYNRWKLGKGMEAMVQAVANFVGKAQVALAGLATGAVLVAIRYDAALYESQAFVDAGGTIPPSLFTGLAVVFCLIPVGLGIAATLILLAYPLKKDLRDRMYADLAETAAGREEAAAKAAAQQGDPA